jgi:D-tyrosyl-tRNA(Tyr) deacylase
VRAIVQRVSEAAVHVDGETVAEIGPGLLILLGVKAGDSAEQAERMAGKLEALRIFEDEQGKMNLNVREAGGEILVVSQFTLYADTSKGNRPSFIEAARADEAEPLYQLVRKRLEAKGGRFGARMSVSLVNDGPVTVILDHR